MSRPRVIFLGTSGYAVPILNRLTDSEMLVTAVLTQPDRASGRRLLIKPPPVKIRALELGLKVFQFEKIRTEEVYRLLVDLSPDVMITASYGKILTERHLGIPPKGVLNVHASLLPQLRGAAPVHRAVMSGMAQTGVTIMKTDAGMDTGPIIAQRHTAIGPDETAGSLEGTLSQLGADLLAETLPDYLRGILTPVPQDPGGATYAPKLTPDDCRIDWNRPACEIDCIIRGLSPEPSAFTFLHGQRLKLYLSRVFDTAHAPVEPGRIIGARKNGGMMVETGEGIVELLEIQPASKGRIRGDQLLQGRYAKSGDTLGIKS